MDNWRHSSSDDQCGPRILPWKVDALRTWTVYIIRNSFFPGALGYMPELPPWSIKVRTIAHAPPEMAAATFDEWLAPSAEDYLTDPLYPDEV